MDRREFIICIAAGVIDACKGTHLFPSVMIAQACLESNNGQSELSAKYSNYFGMKPGSHWTGPVIEMDTTEYVHGQPEKVKQPFRVFDSVEDCIKNHVKMLQAVSVYKNAGVFTATSPEGQAAALRKAGYATDPGYPQKLIAIITECNLKQYDIF